MKLRIPRGAKEIGGTCIDLNSGGKTLLLDLGMPMTLRNPLDVAFPVIVELADGNAENGP